MVKPNVQADTLPEGKVWANPTKSFFVQMLTRDIDLMDAIMDLIDNCIDGVHRQLKLEKNKKLKEYKYKGYFADINLDENQFQLKDNCGGIPLKIAKEYAFRMGRSDEYHDDDNLETVGMYGIGMKRAIFKIGEKADVTSWHEKNMFKVTVPENWVNMPDWYFDCTILKKIQLKSLKETGTVIGISKLHKNISKQFNDKSGFVRDLEVALKKHYGYIIQQGFRLVLNGVKIGPITLNILTTDSKIRNQKQITPYVYSSKIEDVAVEIVIGFYRPPANQEEIDGALKGNIAASERDNAGITVLCNDRVVLYSDKTFLTGWGETPVPKYHTQFISIAGVVHFRSTNPISLPVTTTKRGLDTSSQIYATAKNKIKDGLRFFTSFTNNWKTPTAERAKLFKSFNTINALRPGQSKSSPYIHLVSGKKGDDAKYQIPDLPKPNDAINSLLVTISFQREKTKVQKIRSNLLRDETASAGDVGAWCFDKILSQTGR